MSDSKLGGRYADGLYNAALKEKKTGEVVEAMESLRRAFTEITELRLVWTGVHATPRQKKTVIDEAFAEAPALVRDFLKLLVDKKREKVLYDVFPALSKRHDEELGIVRAELSTPIELDDDLAEKFVRVLKARFGGEIDLSRSVDRSLIAGFRLRYGNRIIDASVQRSIDEIRRRISA